jgi:hypothetical protein
MNEHQPHAFAKAVGKAQPAMCVHLQRYEDEEAAVEAANARADAFSLAGTKVAGMAAHVDDQSSSSSSSANNAPAGGGASDDAGPVCE